MKLSRPAIMKLSEMICGNEPFHNFPYRSSYYLTKFFIDLDLDYTHDGTTRALWVQNVLNELNNGGNSDGENLSKDLCRVIESLVDPDYFLFNDNLEHEKAIKDVNEILKTNRLILKVQSNGQSKISLLNGEFISTAIKDAESVKRITFTPSIFKIPEKRINDDLISVMMPFSPGYKGTYDAIKRTTDHLGLECLRADDIWENSTFIQDIFELIYCARIVIVDFSERNPNVMYETGIAHTLGKIVIPITQSISDIPSDLGHHRAYKYLPNDEGYRNLSNELYKRIKTIISHK